MTVSVPVVALLALLMLPGQRDSNANAPARSQKPAAAVTAPVLAPLQSPGVEPGNVWLVEQKNDQEIYSNGLRIERRYVTHNTPRGFHRIDRRSLQPEAATQSAPVGIIFHTTESHIAPFDAKQNQVLQRVGAALLGFIQQNHSYHFVIDRFGRVYRVVDETDAAHHAGHSVWADDQWAYVGLNQSFLGVSFEAQTTGADGRPTVSPAQVHSARILTEMLRAKYKIAARNCVTHAQVSVNPLNMQVGWHVDWGQGFPFAAVGLPDNYRQPVAAVSLFGFDYEEPYLKNTSEPLWAGLHSAESEVRMAAVRSGQPAKEYTKRIQRRYKELTGIMQARAESSR